MIEMIPIRLVFTQSATTQSLGILTYPILQNSAAKCLILNSGRILNLRCLMLYHDAWCNCTHNMFNIVPQYVVQLETLDA
jgi:hypothetical protein